MVGREEIEQFGDATLGEVLRRLPSVTMQGRPGRGAAPAMRGMAGGYTQFLIDGQRAPPGFAFDSIAPEQVERIEIFRAPTAETGARAIAGTINIVLREPLRQRSDDLRLALTHERQGLQPNVAWTRNDVLGPGGTYNLNLSVARTDPRTDTRNETAFYNDNTGALELAQERNSVQQSTRVNVHLGGRIQWQLGQGSVFSLQPFAVLAKNQSQTTGSLVQTAGSKPAPYASLQSDSQSNHIFGRVMFNWRQRLSDATRLELSGNVGGFSLDSESSTDEFSGSRALVLNQRTTTSIDDRSWALNTKLMHSLADKHSLAFGMEGGGVQRKEDQVTLINGAPAIADFGGNVQASTKRLALFVQDEWEPAKQLSANVGLRWESIQTNSQAVTASGTPSVSNTSSVLTPLAHAVWRFNAPARDQVRLSLTRSYKAPTLQNIVALPSITTLYPAPGGNVASSPDRAGNPELRPELARGIDLAIEHYLARGGVLSVNLFRRDISDLIRHVRALEAVPWANVPRWVSRPQNIGDAVSQGIEMDAKFRLDELMPSATKPIPLSVRANVSLYRSSVSGIPGPDNRIDQQPRASVNLGGDYRVTGTPLTVGGNVSYVPANTVQQSDIQVQTTDMTRVVDAYALWRFGIGTQLRLSINNAMPRNYRTSTSMLRLMGIS